MERKILVAEDSPTQAERIRLLLQGEGYRVHVVSNGRDGLKRVQMEPPDLIISDVVMLGTDGYGFCQAVKSGKRTKQIPVLLLTRRSRAEDILNGLEQGADFFITKPFEDDHFLARVRRVLDHLEFRRKGPLDAGAVLCVGNRQIPIIANRQQIVELLFATVEELIRANAALRERERHLAARTEELAEAKRLLRAVSRHKSEFLATMFHELRSPVEAIIGLTELLREHAQSNPTNRQARYLGHIREVTTRLLQFISDILDLSKKVEAGKLTLRPEVLAVAPTLEDVLVIARGLANKKTQIIQTSIEPALPLLQADPVRFKQILFNLLSNAVKFTPNGGRIAVTARRIADVRSQIADLETSDRSPQSAIANLQSEIPGDFLEIAVTDTGAGIRPEDLPRLFQEFTQLETTQAQKHEGTGLGLALTKKLVELHGGRISAASEGEGRGSTFTVLLPFAGPA